MLFVLVLAQQSTPIFPRNFPRSSFRQLPKTPSIPISDSPAGRLGCNAGMETQGQERAHSPSCKAAQVASSFRMPRAGPRFFQLLKLQFYQAHAQAPRVGTELWVVPADQRRRALKEKSSPRA